MTNKVKMENGDTRFPVVEALRTELRRMSYVPLSDAELETLQHRHNVLHHINAIEDVHPGAEQTAFFDMLFEERVPVDLRQRLGERFVRERLLHTVAPDYD